MASGSFAESRALNEAPNGNTMCAYTMVGLYVAMSHGVSRLAVVWLPTDNGRLGSMCHVTGMWSAEW